MAGLRFGGFGGPFFFCFDLFFLGGGGGKKKKEVVVSLRLHGGVLNLLSFDCALNCVLFNGVFDGLFCESPYLW